MGTNSNSPAGLNHLTAVVFVVAISALGCSSPDQRATGSTDDAIRASTHSASPQALGDADLPVQELLMDLAGPTDVPAAIDASRDVVVARVAEVRPGVRFVGSGPEEDLAGPDYQEVVELRLTVEQVMKGDRQEGDVVAVNWPTYVTSRKDSTSRNAILKMEGLVRELSSDASHLFLLEDAGPPYGVINVSPAFAAAEIDAEGRIDGNVSSGFEEFRGLLVSDLPGIDGSPPRS